MLFMYLVCQTIGLVNYRTVGMSDYRSDSQIQYVSSPPIGDHMTKFGKHRIFKECKLLSRNQIINTRVMASLTNYRGC